VDGFRVWLKVSVMGETLLVTFAPFAMLVLVSVSPPLAAMAPVVNVVVEATTRLPSASLKPETLTVYVCLPPARLSA